MGSGRQFWLESIEPFAPEHPKVSLEGCDIAVIGGGLGGLWTSYYIAKANQGLRIVLLERDRIGHGAATQNVGICHYALPGLESGWVEKHSNAATARLLRCYMIDTVDEYARVFTEEGVEAHYRKTGVLHFASSEAQLGRFCDDLRDDRALGPDVSDFVRLSAAETRERVRLSRCSGAMYSSHCAHFHPGKAVVGLARACERLGVEIREHTEVLGVQGHRVLTSAGPVTAEIVIDITEASPVARLERPVVIPIESYAIATEPLPQRFFDEVGWSGDETLLHARRLFSCAVRTADDRVVLGGLKARYVTGLQSGYPSADSAPIWEDMDRELLLYFEGLDGVRVTHRWSGVMALTANQAVQVGFDAQSGHAFARGFAAEGVAAANLSARILRDLILGQDTDLTRLPLVCRPCESAPLWPVEPLRRLGVSGAAALTMRADESEVRHGHPTLTGRLAGRWLLKVF